MASAPTARSQKVYPLSTYSEVIDKAVSAENLKAVAAKTTDPDVLLGLAFLAKTGDAVRPELSAMAIKAKPEYAPLATVLALTMDGIDEKSVDELIKRDRDNALGHYLQGHLLFESNHENEALEAFRKGAKCPELRLYESTTGPALLKALDALNLKARDRLCALSWMASRSFNFGVMGIQPIQSDLGELARGAGAAKRKEISEILVVLAGHLFASNFNNRSYAQRAIEAAFRLKAEIGAAEKSPAMDGYAAAVQALVSVNLSWPGIKEGHAPIERPLELARFLPSRIHRAFAFADPAQLNSTNLGEMNINLPESDKPASDNAKEKAISAAKALIDVAVTDPDAIVGIYLKGLPRRKYENGPWVSYWSPIEKLMADKPDVFKAAAAHEDANRALWKAGDPDLRRRNIRRMMEIGLGIISYSHDHDKTYPPNLEVLFEKKILKPPLEAKSLITDRPYVYVAGGTKHPPKGTDWDRVVLLYDDSAIDGAYQCVMANGSGQQVRFQDLKAQLERGK